MSTIVIYLPHNHDCSHFAKLFSYIRGCSANHRERKIAYMGNKTSSCTVAPVGCIQLLSLFLVKACNTQTISSLLFHFWILLTLAKDQGKRENKEYKNYNWTKNSYADSFYFCAIKECTWLDNCAYCILLQFLWKMHFHSASFTCFGCCFSWFPWSGSLKAIIILYYRMQRTTDRAMEFRFYIDATRIGMVGVGGGIVPY